MVTTDTTWAGRLNSALDHISELHKDRADALDALTAFALEHPECETDVNLTRARISLL